MLSGLKFTITTSGVKMSKLPGELSKALDEFTPEAADLLLYQAQEEAPVRTGRLRSSLAVTSVKKGVEKSATVSTSSEYAPYIIFGTGPHWIRPAYARVLRWETASGEAAFAKLVYYPGTRANNFMLRAYNAVSGHIEALAAEKIKGAEKEAEQ